LASVIHAPHPNAWRALSAELMPPPLARLTVLVRSIITYSPGYPMMAIGPVSALPVGALPDLF
jgi:hypothetical protein